MSSQLQIAGGLVIPVMGLLMLYTASKAIEPPPYIQIDTTSLSNLTQRGWHIGNAVGITAEPVFYLTTNWVDDPVDKELETGLIYSNITVRLVYENKTNQVTMASKLVGLAGSRKAERSIYVNGWTIGPTNWIMTNQYLLYVN